MVNSSHHQAVAVLGDGLIKAAWSLDDGVVEAAEGTPPKRKRAKRAKKVAKTDVAAVAAEAGESAAASK